jgi:hypothetical protein
MERGGLPSQKDACMKHFLRGALALALVACTSSVARAGLITNGGFESGPIGWNTADQSGNGGWFVQAGTASPLNGFPVPHPPQGSAAAMFDQFGPAGSVLYQDFVVPHGVTAATLSFRLYVFNHADNFIVPIQSSLDIFGLPNQQVRVDLLTASSDPFSLASGDVLGTAFHTSQGDPGQYDSYQLVTADVTGLLAQSGGQTLRLRFAALANRNYLTVGVDDVSLDVRTKDSPEPASLTLLGLGAVGAVFLRRLRRPT